MPFKKGNGRIVQTGVTLQPEVKLKLMRVAKIMERSASSIIAEATEIYLNNKLDEIRKSHRSQVEHSLFPRVAHEYARRQTGVGRIQ